MDNDDLFPKDRANPYDTLVELVNFAEAADQHITQMYKNQKRMIKEYNALRKDYDGLRHRMQQLDMRVTAWEAVVKSLAEQNLQPELEEMSDESKKN